MSASESNPEALMVPATPLVLSEGQRTLAAIVFTDAANFSALMSRDDLRAHRLIGRDLASMRRVCEEGGGVVLKSTGDGLLMVFDSVVRAVSCALEIQTRLREQNRALPGSERLTHRIGIHLGDVFRQKDDVIGDGVNIAARLEAAAWRGCVCVSGAVYEVVRNRLPFHILRRKEQKLKNVGKIVVCQLKPVGGRFDFFFRAWSFLGLSDPRMIRILLGVVVFVSIGLVPGRVNINFSDIATRKDPLHGYALQLGQFGNVEDDDDDAPAPSSSAPFPAAGKNAVTEDEFAVARFNDMRKYDFAAMAEWLAKNDVRDRDGDKLQTVCLSLQALFDWSRQNLKTYSEVNPLIVRDEDGRVASEFWSGTNGGIACKLPLADHSMLDDQIPPVLMAPMLARLLDQDAQTGDAASLALWRGLRFFTSVYQVSLPSPLKREMNRNAQEAVKQTEKS
jgi:class 3 adenylate cyclase